MEESQVTTDEQNREDMNNFSQENPFLLLNHHSFLSKHTQRVLVDCNSQHFYGLNAAPHFRVTTLQTVLQSAMHLFER